MINGPWGSPGYRIPQTSRTDTNWCQTITYFVGISILVAVTHEASEEVGHTDAARSENSINQSEPSNFLFKSNQLPNQLITSTPIPTQTVPFLYNLD